MEKNERLSIVIFLLISIAAFFCFGLFHLTKSETTDEHLWKYGRIKQYWQAIGEKDWEKTYINDKPGVTVALFSGVGLFFEPNPENHKIKDKTFFIFDTSRTNRINFVFRFPILVLAALSLPLFFWLARKAFDSDWMALFFTMFLALNPILIGITQIANPDSFLWIFGGLSVFSYMAFLNKKEKKFFIMTGIFAGFAILSKYTAVILFVFYFLFLLSKMIFQNDREKNEFDFKFIASQLFNIFLIFCVAIVVFIFFIPAIFIKPSYLTKGVSQFFERGNLSMLWYFAVAIVPAFFILSKKNIFGAVIAFISTHRKKLLIIVASLFLLIIGITLLNVLSGQNMIPFDKLRDTAYAQEPKKFNFGKMLASDGFWKKNAKLYLLEAYPFVFSLTLPVFLLTIFLTGKAIFGKIKERHAAIIFSVLIFAMLYFLMALAVKVVANVRYSIILQFFFALFASVSVLELAGSFKNKKYLLIFAALVFVTGFYSLWSVKPFYFSYESPLLPKKFTVNSTWGSGFYEAAEYLNSKPEAENIVIYSNSATICPFLKGKCLNSRKIDLNAVKPDYFVISKRGELKEKNRFAFINSPSGAKPENYYFDNLEHNYEWVIYIDGRKNNYVKVVRFEN